MHGEENGISMITIFSRFRWRLRPASIWYDPDNGKPFENISTVWSLLQGIRQIHASAVKDLVRPVFPKETS